MAESRSAVVIKNSQIKKATMNEQPVKSELYAEKNYIFMNERFLCRRFVLSYELISADDERKIKIQRSFKRTYFPSRMTSKQITKVQLEVRKNN